MAYAKIYMKNPVNGRLRQAPVGFSWTVAFFSFLPALFRKDWFGTFIMLGAALITFGFSTIVFMFIYNKMYIKGLVNDGYLVTSASKDIEFLERKLNLKLPRAKEEISA